MALSSRDVVNPSLTTPEELTADAVLRFRLLVTDPHGLFDADTVAVTVTVTEEANEKPGKLLAPTFSAATPDSLTVEWEEPENSGPAITDYDVQYREGGSGDFTDAQHEGTGLTATLTGLKADTAYQVRVRASNAAGTGDWSESGEGRTSPPGTVGTADWRIDTFAGLPKLGDNGPAVEAHLRLPTGVATDGVGNVYIADGDNHRIRKVDFTGTITTINSFP